MALVKVGGSGTFLSAHLPVEKGDQGKCIGRGDGGMVSRQGWDGMLSSHVRLQIFHLFKLFLSSRLHSLLHPLPRLRPL